MERFYLYLGIITSLVVSCGQPTASDLIRNSRSYSYYSDENSYELTWRISFDDFYSSSNSVSVKKMNGEYYISPFDVYEEPIYVSCEHIQEVTQWLDSVYGRLCEIENSMVKAGVYSLEKEINIPSVDCLYYFDHYSDSLCRLHVDSTEIMLSEYHRDIRIKLSYRSRYYNYPTSLWINKTVYDNARNILQDYEYMKSCLDEAIAYEVMQKDFADTIR